MRAQLSQIFVYILSAAVIALILGYGYRAVTGMIKTSRVAELESLKLQIVADFSKTRAALGSVRQLEYRLPSQFDAICFVDLNKREQLIDPADPRNASWLAQDWPLIWDSIATERASYNAFLVGEAAFEALDVGNIKIGYDPGQSHVLCVNKSAGVVSFELKGKGTHALLRDHCGNKAWDGDEEDVDCGGYICAACACEPWGDVNNNKLLDCGDWACINTALQTGSASDCPNLGLCADFNKDNAVDSSDSDAIAGELGDCPSTTKITLIKLDEAEVLPAGTTKAEFIFNVSNTVEPVVSCSLILDGVVVATNESTAPDTETVLTAQEFAVGEHSWHVRCIDGLRSYESGSRNFSLSCLWCTVGDRQCTDDWYKECISLPGGCSDWSEQLNYSCVLGNLSCEEASWRICEQNSTSNCTDWSAPKSYECAEGDLWCNETGWSECVRNESGCLVWLPESPELPYCEPEGARTCI